MAAVRILAPNDGYPDFSKKVLFLIGDKAVLFGWHGLYDEIKIHIRTDQLNIHP